MTFSIVGRSGDALGVAVASKFLAVGAAVPAAEADTGALATQAWANLAFRVQGLALLRTGVAATDAVAGLTAADPGRADRQLGVVGATGAGATYTGEQCPPWAGGVAGDGYAIQGNILTGPEVVAAMEAAWRASSGRLARRLLAALAAGDEAGGDRRGRQSAALLVVKRGGGYGGTSDVAVDLRVDDDPAPVAALARLLDQHRRREPRGADGAGPHRSAGAGAPARGRLTGVSAPGRARPPGAAAPRRTPRTVRSPSGPPAGPRRDWSARPAGW